MERRTALITGAARGIGAAIARMFSRQSVSLALHYWNFEPEAKALAQELFRQDGSHVTLYRADLSRPDNVYALGTRVLEEFGTVDILVNNAAVAVTDRVAFINIQANDWNKVMAVNVTAPFILSQVIAPRMADNRWGRIINIVSVNWIVAYVRHAAYVTSKAALVGQTRALARELGDSGITVNAISPGDIRTESVMERLGSTLLSDDNLQQRQCIPHPGSAEDVANAVEFLARESSGYITGSVLAVDGGWALI